MKILALDLELSPNIAHVWGLWNNNVSLSQLQESQEVICFGAKWVGGKKFFFRSVHHDDKKTMLDELWALVDGADAILGWNSKAFDMKHLRREWIENGYTPPSPVKHLDLMLTARSQFRFPSNKLAYVSQKLLGTTKVDTGGHDLWVKCMAGDSKAWAKMKTYQRKDVELLEPLYEKMKPWIPNHPNAPLHSMKSTGCQVCESTNLERRGYRHTGVSTFQRYRCNDCGAWGHYAMRLGTSDTRS